MCVGGLLVVGRRRDGTGPCLWEGGRGGRSRRQGEGRGVRGGVCPGGGMIADEGGGVSGACHFVVGLSGRDEGGHAG